MIDRKIVPKDFYEEVSGVDWPTYDEFLKGAEFSDKLDKKEIAEFEKQIKQFLNKYEYLSRRPLFKDLDELSERERSLLMESETFCMVPWVHMHAFPDGRAYPCCLGEYWHPIGDLRKNTMEEVWNQDAYKTMRQNMLQDKPSIECTKCYEHEKVGAFSLRNDMNRNYGHHISDIHKTKSDGTLDQFKIRYWDVRFSNLCNFSCRSCGPIFSSNWFNDHVKLYDKKPDVLGREMARVEYTAGDENAMLEQMEQHIPYLEQVYFAGGEPLIMKEHYYLLEKLIEYGKTDIRIQYNTNFSEMRYKDKHVYDYWKHFKNVSVGASLDAMGPRAELMRKGTDWEQTLDNRQHMLSAVPHVDFYISSTVSAMNVLHVLDFHKEWTEMGLIEAKDWNINLCQSPDWYRPDIFPQWFKDEVITPAYEKHIAWLDPQDSLRRATNGFKSVLNLIQAQDNYSLWPEFENQIAKLDVIRNENFWLTFPEYKELNGTS